MSLSAQFVASEVRSVKPALSAPITALRRVEKLTDAALATDDADAHHLAEAARRTLEQLVDYLVLAKQQRHRAVQRALRQVR